MKLISIVSPCYNEEDNVGPLTERLQQVLEQLPQYRYEIILIDNASTDNTVARLRELAAKDKRIKVIVNMRNFGHLRSPYYAFLQAYGDAVIFIASDLQDPPEMIPKFVEKWEEGAMVVAASKMTSKENPIMHALRGFYYKLLKKMATVEVIEHFTGFGLYDRRVMDELRKIDDVYPYLRGLISELGFKPVVVPFEQQKRTRGITHNNFFTLFDLAMLGLTTHSVVPMRMATIAGFILAMLSFGVALFYLIYKLLFWSWFDAGMAPLVIGIFGMFSIQLIFIGLVGEYVGSIHRQLLRRPLVVERERINFDPSLGTASGANHQVVQDTHQQTNPIQETRDSV